jgi:hypothetical protein
LCGSSRVVNGVVEGGVENVVNETQYFASSTPDNAVVVEGVDL